MQSPVIAELARIPLASRALPTNMIAEAAKIRCLMVGSYLSLFIDGDEAHREPPPVAARYSRAHRRHLAFRGDVLGEDFGTALLYHNDQLFQPGT